jgi:hypothetical protein
MRIQTKYSIALILAGILAVITAGCSSKSTPSTPPAPATTSAPATTQQTSAAATTAPTQRPGASGTIASINGNTLTLTTNQGQATVIVGPSTDIEKTVSGTLADIVAGQFVTVAGTTDSNGDITATSISIRPQNQNNFNPSGGTTPFTGTRPTGTSTTPGTSRPSNFAGRGTSGTVDSINGSVLVLTTLQTPQTQVTVNISSDTTIEKSVSGSLADLTVGSFVTAFGTADSSGVISAASVTLLPAGQSGRFAPPSTSQ